METDGSNERARAYAGSATTRHECARARRRASTYVYIRGARDSSHVQTSTRAKR